MAEENIDTTGTETETVPAVESAQDSTAERMFTQAEVNALMAKEVSKVKRKLKKQKQQRQDEQIVQPSDEEPSSLQTQVLNKILGRLEALETAGSEQRKETSFNALVGSRNLEDDVKSMLYATYDPSNPEITSSMIDKLAAPDTPEAFARELDSRNTGYVSPGSPAQSPGSVRGLNPMLWSKDDINVLKQEGRFLEQLEKWRGTLPGGGGNLFANRKKK